MITGDSNPNGERADEHEMLKENGKKGTISIKYNENSGFVDWEFMCMLCSVASTADIRYSCGSIFHAHFVCECVQELYGTMLKNEPDISYTRIALR